MSVELKPRPKRKDGQPFRSRHDPSAVVDTRLIISDGLFEYLELFNPYNAFDSLPRNWAEAFFDKHPEHFRHFLGELTCARTKGPQQLLARYLFNEDSNFEMMKYYLSEAGEKLLLSEGRINLAYRRSRTHTKHQLTGDLRRASLELGIRADPRFSLHGPDDILSHRKMGVYDTRCPFTYVLPDKRRYTPDDKPLILRRTEPRTAQLLLFEDDRASEGTKPSDINDQTRLHEKFEKIQTVFRYKLYEKKYGIKSALLLFATTAPDRAPNVRDYLLETFGPMPYVKIRAFPTFHKLWKTVPVTTEAWHGEWLNVDKAKTTYKLSQLGD